MNTFSGYIRKKGAPGVRNHVAILPTVSCANGVAMAIAGQVPEAVPLYHSVGCGRAGEDHEVHRNTLINLCCHPNVGALLLVSLGCEVLKADELEAAAADAGRPVRKIVIQEEGGSVKSTAKGVAFVRELLNEIGSSEPEQVPFSELTIGLECGGSDAFSGVTANPAVGRMADHMVDLGASVILTETTEMIGTSHILARRAKTPEVSEKIKSLVSRQWEKCERILGPVSKVVISPGNMDGGMTNIREKALGCIVKAGTRDIVEVVSYGQKPTEKGVVIMDGPGYDTDSLTGMAAAGAQVMVFTTGRGNPIGFPIVPVIKVISTTQAFQKLEDDIDINAGVILEGQSLEEVGASLTQKLSDTTNGDLTKAEINQQNGIMCVYTQHSAF